jgi:hypothetical protein
MVFVTFNTVILQLCYALSFVVSIIRILTLIPYVGRFRVLVSQTVLT